MSRRLFEPEFNGQTVSQLLLHVIHGEQDEAEAMISANPDLLLEEGEVIDYSGRTIKRTAFQMAVGAEDVEMAEMIAQYLDEYYPGEKEKQYEEQFPVGEGAVELWRQHQDSEALNAVVDAIGSSHTNEDCAAAFQTFGDYLESQAKNVITTGKHFNVQLLVEAFRLCSYDQNSDAFRGWNNRQNNLFWCNVINPIQRFLPTCYAQAFCQRLDQGEGGESLRRSSEMSLGQGVITGALSRAVHGVWKRGRVRRACLIGLSLLEKLCQEKTVGLHKLMQNPDEQPQPWCLVM